MPVSVVELISVRIAGRFNGLRRCCYEKRILVERIGIVSGLALRVAARGSVADVVEGVAVTVARDSVAEERRIYPNSALLPYHFAAVIVAPEARRRIGKGGSCVAHARAAAEGVVRISVAGYGLAVRIVGNGIELAAHWVVVEGRLHGKGRAAPGRHAVRIGVVGVGMRSVGVAHTGDAPDRVVCVGNGIFCVGIARSAHLIADGTAKYRIARAGIEAGKSLVSTVERT